MYYKQVKLNDAAQKVYDQLRVVVAKNRPDPDVFIEQLRQILNARELIGTINRALQCVIDEDPRTVEYYAEVGEGVRIGNLVDSDAKMDDWHDECDRCANHMEVMNVHETDMPERDQ